MNRRPLGRAGLVGAGLLVVTACAGERPGYDPAPVEAYLRGSQVGTFAPVDHLGRASCPDHLPLREGLTFTCRLDVDGASLPYRVHLTHVHEAAVSIAASPAGVLLSARRLRAFVRGALPAGESAAAVDCGSAYVVATVGQSLPCTLTLGAAEKQVRIRVEDEAGRVSLRS